METCVTSKLFRKAMNCVALISVMFFVNTATGVGNVCVLKCFLGVETYFHKFRIQMYMHRNETSLS